MHPQKGYGDASNHKAEHKFLRPACFQSIPARLYELIGQWERLYYRTVTILQNSQNIRKGITLVIKIITALKPTKCSYWITVRQQDVTVMLSL